MTPNRDPKAITANEWRILDLVRELKARPQHSTLRVEIKDHWEVLYEPLLRELPPERPPKARC